MLRSLLGVAAIFQIAGALLAEPLLLDVAKAEFAIDERYNTPMVVLRLTEASERKFAEITSPKVSGLVEVRVEGKVLTLIWERKPESSHLLLGSSGVPEAQNLAARLAGGAKLEIESPTN